MRYIVQWPSISLNRTVETPTGTSTEDTVLHRGATVPDGFDLANLEMLRRVGALTVAADDPSQAALTALADSSSVAVVAVARPAKTAPKSEWVAYAVAQGEDESKAESMTKADLVETFGGEPEPEQPEPPVVVLGDDDLTI